MMTLGIRLVSAGLRCREGGLAAAPGSIRCCSSWTSSSASTEEPLAWEYVRRTPTSARLLAVVLALCLHNWG